MAANYRAAYRARSKREVIAAWNGGGGGRRQRVIIETGLLPITKLKPLPREADEIVSIMAASRKSAIANRQSAIR